MESCTFNVLQPANKKLEEEEEQHDLPHLNRAMQQRLQSQTCRPQCGRILHFQRNNSPFYKHQQRLHLV